MEERRQSKRSPDNKAVDYSVSVLEVKELKMLSLKGDLVDLSDKGMCMCTSYPLEPGHVLRFANGIGNKIGIVKWSKHTINEIYKVGIKFI